MREQNERRRKLQRYRKRGRRRQPKSLRIYGKTFLVFLGCLLLLFLVGKTGAEIYQNYEERTCLSLESALNMMQLLMHAQKAAGLGEAADGAADGNASFEGYIDGIDSACLEENLTWKRAEELFAFLTEEDRRWLEEHREKERENVKAQLWDEWYRQAMARAGKGADDTGDFEIFNLWIQEKKGPKLSCFYEGQDVVFVSAALAGEDCRETVADLFFQAGKLKDLNPKTQKVSGKLLRVTQEGAELENAGFLPFSENFRGYQLYGDMKMLNSSDLCIGYNFSDFVVENGRIEAALQVRKEAMENIRVLIQSSDYGGRLHETLKLTADCDCLIKGADSRLLAGEVLEISAGSLLFENADRICIVPEALTGKIRLLNVSRSAGAMEYRGSLELLKTEQGICVINELLLEEYLYAVVPSEMPASYPEEALQAQAICARTYACEKMKSAGLAEYGAHVDDSTAFQVYNNIDEDLKTTEAVKATSGQVLFYEGEPAQIYYYSTSCGYGTDLSVWQDGNEALFPYLVSRKIGEGDIFYEQEEPWYRWSYEVKALDENAVYERICARYRANPSMVLTRQANGSFSSEKPVPLGRIKDISILERGAGGVADSLLIEGEKVAYLVRKEYNIRSVLCDGKTQVLRQDGTFAGAASILPSAFLEIQAVMKENFVTGYALSGGGYGHGVGLSQNGAKQMAKNGMNAEEITEFFFPGCRMERIY